MALKTPTSDALVANEGKGGYQGHIGNEQFGMRQYLYIDGSSSYLLRIIFKEEASKEAIFAAAEVQLLWTLDSLASSR